MEKIYVANHRPHFYGRSGKRQENENMNPTNLYLKLNTAEELKMHLPKGRLNIYDNKDGLNIFIAEKKIQKTSKGNNIQLHLKTTQDILHKFTTKDFNESTKGYLVTIEAEFKNLKDKKVTLIWTESSGRPLEIIESSIDFNKDNAFEISANVELESGSTRKETITIFTPKRD